MDERERLDLDEIRAIIRLATEADLAELIVEAPHLKVHVKTAGAGVPSAAPVAAPTRATAAPVGAAHLGAASPDGAQAADGGAARYIPIVAPMVGTFYRASKPDGAPFVTEGDVVQTGQTVCVLEAMKMFNEIPSEVSGRIVRVLAENGAPVEYGQPLFLVDPAAAA
ncbi:MAG TPA: acetyl-CoA carboxylase biotin carboxyl carrier protein [bacterium]|nr:acetyl-CoA carboxylase biotin carboxyl carrier protein [bacterium]